MSFIITPGQLAKRAEMYQQLGQLTAAGIGVTKALDMIRRNPPSRTFRAPLDQMLQSIASGKTFTEALREAKDWLPEFDIALLHAGEQSGRMDSCFKLLSEYYFQNAQITRQLLSQLVYPVGLIHFAVLVFRVVLPWAGSSFNESLPVLFLKAALLLSPLYLFAALLIYVMQSKHGEVWRATIEKILHPIPFIGSARRDLALSRLATSLEALISAGVTIIEAWTIAAQASGSPALRSIVAAWSPQFALGRTPAELVRNAPRFPEMFSNLYTSGEVSGKLDESLRHLRTYYHGEGTRKLQALAEWIPRAIYAAVALAVGYFIITFYTNYFNAALNAF